MAAIAAVAETLPSAITGGVETGSVYEVYPVAEPTQPDKVWRRELRNLVSETRAPTSPEETAERILNILPAERYQAVSEVLMVQEIKTRIARRNQTALLFGGFVLGISMASLLSYSLTGVAWLPPLASISLGVIGLGLVGIAFASVRTLD